MLRIGSDSEFVEITELDRNPAGAPMEGDLRVSVGLRFNDFAGRYDAVWLEEPVLAKFVMELSHLEKLRQGEATLVSMSPDEFSLTIRARDSLGHFVVQASLCRYQYSGPTYWRTAVSGGFEIDPGSLAFIATEFKHLHTP